MTLSSLASSLAWEWDNHGEPALSQCHDGAVLLTERQTTSANVFYDDEKRGTLTAYYQCLKYLSSNAGVFVTLQLSLIIKSCVWTTIGTSSEKTPDPIVEIACRHKRCTRTRNRSHCHSMDTSNVVARRQAYLEVLISDVNTIPLNATVVLESFVECLCTV